MNDPHIIVPISPIPVSTYLVSGDLPTWEQIPPACQKELVVALANLLIQLPELQLLLEAHHDAEP
jgi:hypothetical protein